MKALVGEFFEKRYREYELEVVEFQTYAEWSEEQVEDFKAEYQAEETIKAILFAGVFSFTPALIFAISFFADNNSFTL